MTELERIPRFGGLPIVGNSRRFRTDPLGLARDAFERCGDVVRVGFGGKREYVGLYHPDDVGRALAQGHRLHRDLLRQLFGNGLFVMQTSTSWQRHRRLLQPAFHPSRLPAYVGTITARVAAAMVERLLAAGRAGRVVTLEEELKFITVGTMLRLVFGPMFADPGERLAGALRFIVDHADHALFDAGLVPSPLDFLGERRMRAAMATLRARIVREMHRRRAEASRADGSLLHAFLEAEGANDSKLDDEEVVSEVFSTFVAGTETSSALLAWVFVLLTRNPSWKDRLAEEVRDVLGDRLPTFDDLARLGNVRNAVLEAARLYPPGWALFRTLEKETSFRFGTLPVGTRVGVSPFVTHRHPQFWDDPERFDPTRFEPAKAKDRARFAYFPFGGGGHQCIGFDLSMVESQLIVAMILQRLDVTVLAPDAVTMRPRIALMPGPPPRARLRLVERSS